MSNKVMRKCRECGLEARSSEDLELFATDKKQPYGRKQFCRECHSKASTERCKSYRAENKEKIKEYLGGTYRCADCGLEHEYPGLFDFHHIDGSTKEHGISRIMGNSWNKVKHELEKCICLCANCHRLRHRTDL